MTLDVRPFERPKRIGFLQVPEYSQLAFSAAVEPLRMANALSGQSLYEWQLITLDGQAVKASNGVAMMPDASIQTAGPMDLLIVCSGVNVHNACDRRLLTWLSNLARRKTALGAVCTGAYILARADVLKGYRCTIHWENISSIHEELLFPDTIFSAGLFVIDRDRYTCSGGIAPLDMMLNLISDEAGTELAEAISEEYLHERIRSKSDHQRIPLRVHLGEGQPKLRETVSLMEANIEEPLSLDELAAYVKVSRRQLERLFKKYLNRVPTRYYLELRLERARQLLLQTSMPIIDIALACGFSSPPHFSKCYHEHFGRPPSSERRKRRPPLESTDA